MAFEVKDYTRVLEISGRSYKIDVGDTEYLQAVQNKLRELAEFLKSIKGDKAELIKLVSEKKKLINFVLGSDKACDEILGDKANSVRNINDLFDYALAEIAIKEVQKLSDKAVLYEPLKDGGGNAEKLS